MGNRIVNLTEQQFKEIIHNAVLGVMNEMDGKTYARVANVSNNAKLDNQNGNYIHTINNTKSITNDDYIAKAILLEPKVRQHLIREFVDTTFMFYAYDSLRNTAIISFKLADIKKLEKRQAILKGDVTFNNTKLNGNLIVFLDTKKVVYNHPDKHRYTLEIDNRFVNIWNELIDKLDEAEQNLPQ
ncbi:MAG: hypothetical protein MJ197_10700 [Bacteroidales bacterium]|nr:hypothetical protein [Bacteroidales bacterium]